MAEKILSGHGVKYTKLGSETIKTEPKYIPIVREGLNIKRLRKELPELTKAQLNRIHNFIMKQLTDESLVPAGIIHLPFEKRSFSASGEEVKENLMGDLNLL